MDIERVEVQGQVDGLLCRGPGTKAEVVQAISGKSEASRVEVKTDSIAVLTIERKRLLWAFGVGYCEGKQCD